MVLKSLYIRSGFRGGHFHIHHLNGWTATMNVMQPLAECADDLSSAERTDHWRQYLEGLDLEWGKAHAVIIHESPQRPDTERHCHLVVRLLESHDLGAAGYKLKVMGAGGLCSIYCSHLLSFKRLSEDEVLFFADLQLSAAGQARRPRVKGRMRFTSRTAETSPLY